MLVKILKSFPCASDAGGVAFRQLEAGTVEDVPDDLVPGLTTEGYVETPKGSVIEAKVVEAAPDAALAESVEPPQPDPFDHDGDGKPGGAPKGGNRRKKA